MWLPPPCLSSPISLALIPALIYSTPQGKQRLTLSSGVLSLMPPVTSNMQWYNFSPGRVTESISARQHTSHFWAFLMSLTRALCSHKLFFREPFINMLIQGVIRWRLFGADDPAIDLLRDRLCWKVCAQKLQRPLLQTQSKLFLTPSSISSFLFSHSSNFPQECWGEEELVTATSNCYQSVIRSSLLLLLYFHCFSTQACAQHCLQIRHLGDEWNLLPKSCDVLDFLRSEQLLQPPFIRCCSENHFLCVCYIHSLSLSALSSLPFRVSFAI